VALAYQCHKFSPGEKRGFFATVCNATGTVFLPSQLFILMDKVSYLSTLSRVSGLAFKILLTEVQLSIIYLSLLALSLLVYV
jgi:hypothetical protein